MKIITEVPGTDYTDAVMRARDVEQLDESQRARVLDRLAARYPEVVAAVLEELLVPKGAELTLSPAEAFHRLHCRDDRCSLGCDCYCHGDEAELVDELATATGEPGC